MCGFSGLVKINKGGFPIQGNIRVPHVIHTMTDELDRPRVKAWQSRFNDNWERKTWHKCSGNRMTNLQV